ncbi:PAPA-1-like conserved region domain containing protein [Naviculisporaceae sp. PSN 640]
MSSRPRRSAAQRATEAITDMADRDNERVMTSRSRRSGGAATISRGPPSSPSSSVADSSQHLNLNVKMPPNKLRQATSGNKRNSSGSSAPASSSRGQIGRNTGSSRTRGNKKSYVVESESDEEEEEEEEEGEDEIEVGTRAGLADDDDDDEEEEDEEMGDVDAQGELDDEMDVDAEGEEDDEDADADADGDIDMDATPQPPPPAIKISKPTGGRGVAVPVPKSSKPTTTSSTTAAKFIVNDDDDDELSELESEPEDVTGIVQASPGDGEEDAEGEEEDVDAEGEEIEVADEDGEGEEEEELDSDDEGVGSRGDTPDLTKLTARQRAKLGDVSHEYMKLSDEVQAKKVFTAEELSMRRAEMARRRRNLSEKRNEEVKMETINKLLKKQAPKTNRRNAILAGDETPNEEPARADPTFIRWVSTKEGSRVAVPDEMLIGPAGRLFMGGGGKGLPGGKMVQEVS